jgi:hypothetical protein
VQLVPRAIEVVHFGVVDLEDNPLAEVVHINQVPPIFSPSDLTQ